MDILILMAPMQIRQSLSIGNIYDLLLCDFYNKVCKMHGDKSSFALLINACGSPIQKLAKKLRLQPTNEKEYFKICTDQIEIIIDQCKKYFIDADRIIRDDNNQQTLNECVVPIKVSTVMQCPKCKQIYGTDPNIQACKYCGNIVERVKRETLVLPVDHKDIRRKIERIEYYPHFAKNRLLDYVSHLPDRYEIALEKNRVYTMCVKDYQIDPRYAAITTLIAARNLAYPQNRPNKIIHVHGDVMKKFSYYVLVYLDDIDTPDMDVMHGSIVDAEHQKLRWEDDGHSNSVKERREIRAFLLTRSIDADIVFDINDIKNKSKSLTKTYVICERLQETRNLSNELHGIRPDLQVILDEFYRLAFSWKLPLAYDAANRFIRKCWRITKDEKLSSDEQKIIAELQSLYFGYNKTP